MAARRSKKAAGGSLQTRDNRGALALPQDEQDEYAEFLSRDKASATQAGGWPWVKTEGSTAQMYLGQEKIGDETGAIEAVILGGNRANMLFPPYTPGVFQPPTCFAVADPNWDPAEIEEKLAPPADLESREADACKGCPMNAFGSAAQGRGKACKNTVRLAMLPAYEYDDRSGKQRLRKNFEKVEGVLLSIPPTSAGSRQKERGALWGAYVSQWVSSLKRPLFTLVTRIRKVPNEKGAGFTLQFEMAEPIQDASVRRVLKGRAESDGFKALVQPPPSGESTGSGAPSGKAPQRRQKVERTSGRARRAAAGR